ncbi:hypothetical protein [Mesorhizobium sp.]|uniref:hypothetical protein n=1 Tax=Mesorhizobium sp. TaxID=1871066 RepID=UPI000FE736F5|nr:hypothetical protein [Mesorhizobium sp.]RWF33730.1 MAG: hypothetical protein EOS45_02015 [Mesorhizobium sp.]
MMFFIRSFFVPNVGAVAKHSHSFHFNALCFLCLAVVMLESAWPYLADYLPISPVAFAILAGLFSGLALPARFIISKQLSGAPDADKQDQSDAARP